MRRLPHHHGTGGGRDPDPDHPSHGKPRFMDLARIAKIRNEEVVRDASHGESGE